jgi:16S rRNA U516 pseudouridylate synthase RsuA-like enzyme
MDENNAQEKGEFPIRINKYLAMEGRGSRREMDKLISEGKVIINGRVAVLGDKVNEGDKIEVRFRGLREKQIGNDQAAGRLRRKGKGRR